MRLTTDESVIVISLRKTVHFFQFPVGPVRKNSRNPPSGDAVSKECVFLQFFIFSFFEACGVVRNGFLCGIVLMKGAVYLCSGFLPENHAWCSFTLVATETSGANPFASTH
jgi:hypothetical protein